MIFIDTTKNKGTITVDGYSKRKSLEAAIKDMGRYIRDHVDESEGNGVLEYGVESLWANDGESDYFFEVEEVGCATRYDENGNAEYEDANWYLAIRVVLD